MAACAETAGFQIVDLRQVPGAALHGLLDEETEVWRRRLHWDFQPAAELVLRYVRMHSLEGVALLHDGETAGYAYHVCEERKGLIGDVYVREAYRSPETEALLIDASLDSLLKTSYIQRIEAQLMLLSGRPAQMRHPPQCYPRLLLLAGLDGAAALPPAPALRLKLENWSTRYFDDAATLIADVYREHVDSRINDQYRSVSGARRFLQNIVQYPGCGQFFARASFAAFEPRNAGLIGIVLGSLIGAEAGHITQVCVSPGYQGTGLGYELMRRALAAFARHGCKEATLTVTAGNTQAIRLYTGLGFRCLREFDALVWDGLRA